MALHHSCSDKTAQAEKHIYYYLKQVWSVFSLEGRTLPSPRGPRKIGCSSESVSTFHECAVPHVSQPRPRELFVGDCTRNLLMWSETRCIHADESHTSAVVTGRGAMCMYSNVHNAVNSRWKQQRLFVVCTLMLLTAQSPAGSALYWTYNPSKEHPLWYNRFILK